jgi:hypothetical protein
VEKNKQKKTAVTGRTAIMIIDAKTIIVTLIIVSLGFYLGIKLIRGFALQIARENHDAILAMDNAEEGKRRKQERAADSAEASAYAKVKPILTTPAISTAKSTESAPAAGSIV